MKRTASRPAEGFTFVEILVALVVAGLVIGSAAFSFHAVGANARRFSTVREIDIGSAAALNDFGLGSGAISVYNAPNYGRLGFAFELKDRLLEDVQGASAVYCLDRDRANTVRPATIAFPLTDPGDTRPPFDTSERFRQYLISAEPTAATVFPAARNVPANDAASIFVLGESGADEIRVIAVYDIDLIDPVDRTGIYASAKRYVGGNLTHYYDTYYEDGAGDAFRPLFVTFETRSRLSLDEGDAAERFKVARDTPFHLVWWPDPTFNFLQAPTATATYPTTDPRTDYGHHRGKTSLLTVLPMFPSL